MFYLILSSAGKFLVKQVEETFFFFGAKLVDARS